MLTYMILFGHKSMYSHGLTQKVLLTLSYQNSEETAPSSIKSIQNQDLIARVMAVIKNESGPNKQPF